MKKLYFAPRRFVVLSVLLYFGIGVTSVLARTWIVTNNNPTGEGSLFEALGSCYREDTIVLDQISGQTIHLNFSLGHVLPFVKIKNSGAPVIVDGTDAGENDGLVVDSYAIVNVLEMRNFHGAGIKVAGAGVTLNGVKTTGNTGNGVVVQAGANNTTIINLTSTNNTENGILLEAIQFLRVTGNTTITNNGGDGIKGAGINYSFFAPPYIKPLSLEFGPPPANLPHLVISDNGGAGIRLDGANYNVIRGAYIGTDSTGMMAQPNAWGGIILNGATYNFVGGDRPGQGNLISGNAGQGLVLVNLGGPNYRNSVIGNFFGTNINGTAVIGGLPSEGAGDALVIENASENFIGGNSLTGPAGSPRGGTNLFSGNRAPIVIRSIFAKTNFVQGNLIGTDLTGIIPLGNDDSVTLFQAGTGNLVGGQAPGDGNLIGAAGNNKPGLRIDQTPNVVVQGNFFGTNATGTSNLGNTGSGIYVFQSNGATVGGRSPAQGNIIFYNGVDGVTIEGPNANNNFVGGNVIFYNAGQGLNLLGGANNLQAPPQVDSGTTAGGITVVTGSFSGPASTPFFIDLYANPSGKVGSANQGRHYLGGGMFTTLANGTGTFSINAPPVPGGNKAIVATKTDAAGNSSTFSLPMAVQGDSMSADFVLVGKVTNDSSTGVFHYLISVINDGPGSAENASLRDIVPPELVVTSCKVFGGPAQVIQNGNDCTVNFGTLAKSEGRDIYIEVRVADSLPGYIGAPITNTARITSTTPDPNQSNNVAYTATRVGLPTISFMGKQQKPEGGSGVTSDYDRISRFDTDVEGWTVNNTGVVHVSNGGNPGGYMFIDNPETTVSIAIAPPKFLGDLLRFKDGVLSFDGNMLQQNAPPYNAGDDYGHVIISGPAGSASVDLVPGQPPENSWMSFSKPLDAGTWGKTQAQWSLLLSSVTSITLSVEARFGGEMQGIDNFKILRPLNRPDGAEGSIIVTVPEGLTETVMVDFETVDGTAVAGEDYAPVAGTLVFPPGTTSRSFDVTIIGDDARETDETFLVRFSNPVNAALALSEMTVTILDDDGGLANISTRLEVGTGSNVLIGGFIIPDVSHSSETKKVLVRGIGPSLPLPGKLDDPKLGLFDSNGAMLGANDNWRVTQIGGVITSDNVAAIKATTIPPTNDNEAAMVVDLPVGAYTAVLSGVNDTTGIGLVEAYDLDSVGPLRLGNISTRGFVNAGDNVMIGGLISIGARDQILLTRAIGPSLVSAGISDALPDPMLELYDSNGALVGSNDNWRSDQESEIIATGIPPTHDAESALLSTVTPGAYTAVVRGVGATTGVGLVEFYRLE